MMSEKCKVRSQKNYRINLWCEYFLGQSSKLFLPLTRLLGDEGGAGICSLAAKQIAEFARSQPGRLALSGLRA